MEDPKRERAHRCPNCGNGDEIYREESRRTFRDAVMWILRRYPYLCRACEVRFYDRSLSGRRD
jgi:predicted RNA-binding Zn-ribbon protein involved in translation (DUF1610 family)